MKSILMVLFTFLLTITCSLLAQARVDIQETDRMLLPEDFYSPRFTIEDSQRLVPKNTLPGQTATEVLYEMVDNSFQMLIEGPSNKRLPFSRNSVQANGSTKPERGPAVNPLSKINVKLLAMQALAKIEYVGWIRAGFNYNAKAETSEAEVSNNIFNNQNLKLTHSINAVENTSKVSWVIKW